MCNYKLICFWLFLVQMELCLGHLTAQEREFSVAVETLAQTEQALKKLNTLESNAQVSLHQCLL